jgi:hypothetical protein
MYRSVDSDDAPPVQKIEHAWPRATNAAAAGRAACLMLMRWVMTPFRSENDVLVPRQPDVEGLVTELRRIYVGAGVELAVNMGRLIIERLFCGDLERWRSRGRKDVSFRKLEKHPDLPFRASTLSRAVAIYMLSKRRGDLSGFRHVRPSHLHEIARLTEEDQDKLLAIAEKERWSMRRLREEVARMSTPRPYRRPAQPQLASWMRGVRDEFDSRTTAAELDRLADFDLDEARDLLDATRGVLRSAEVLARRLVDRIRQLDAAGHAAPTLPMRSVRASA